jgi:hypothetical protein
MKALLICPADRQAVVKLAEVAPLANLPILGETLVEYWLEHLAGLRAKEVQVLAADRPEQVRAQIGDGARWGLHVEVLPETRELTVDEARAKYRRGASSNWLAEPNDVILVDRLPDLPRHALFDTYAHWFAASFAWLSHTASPLRVGTHEIQPGVWAGLRTHIDPTARLHAPCWLGQNVWIGPEAVIGPAAVLEDRVFVEGGANISHSLVGTETFVGGMTALQESIAWGRTVVNWRTGSAVEVADPFLLCGLHHERSGFKRSNWITRLAALGLLVLGFPAAACVMCRSKRRGQPAMRRKVAFRPHARATSAYGQRLVYYELASINRWLRRWPQLWNVMRGDFTWIGNRPLSPPDAEALRNEFERLWLAAPIGLISLADAVGCPQAFNDEARAHAAFYAVKANRRLDCSIFVGALAASLFGIHRRQRNEESVEAAASFRPEIMKGEAK